MTENGKKFMDALEADESLKKELEAKGKGVELSEQYALVAEFANAHGFDITVEDLRGGDKPIDLDELETVAGGGGCGCAIVYGYGSGAGLKCDCGSYGSGGVDGNKQPNSQGGCECICAGAGATNRH